MSPSNLTGCISSTIGQWVLDMTDTAIAGLLGIVIGGWFLYRYYKGNYKKAKRALKLKDSFFNPWLIAIKKEDNNYCKIGVQYSTISEKMVRFEPKDPDDLLGYRELIKNSKKYKHLLKHWRYLKRITLELNTELSIPFQEIKCRVKEEINLPFYCLDALSDEPVEYICYDAFIRAIYEETIFPLETEPNQKNEIKINPRTSSDELKWGNLSLAASSKEGLMLKAKLLFESFVEDKKYKEQFANFLDKRKKTYDLALKTVTQDMAVGQN
jgi:hypothetical protein